MFRKSSFIVFVIVIALQSLLAQQPDTTNTNVGESNVNETSAYVVFDGDSLFKVTANLGPYTPEERARNISERLIKLSDELNVVQDSFNITEANNYSIIAYKDFVIMSLYEADVAPLGGSQQEVGNAYIEIFKKALTNKVKNDSLIGWLINIGYTALFLLGLILILYIINRLFKWINRKLVEYEKKLKRKRKSVFRYLAPKGPDYFFVFVSNIIRFVLIVLILFLYFPLVFSRMPWAEGFVSQFYEYIRDPIMDILTAFRNFLPNVFYIFIIVFITRYILQVLTYVAGEIENEKLKIKGFHRYWANPTLNLVKIIIYAFALVFIFPYLPGSESPAFRGISIFLGILFSLGSTSAIANIVAGIVITYMRPFLIGDRVKIGDVVGDVVEKTLLVTRLRTLKNEDVTIPNATIINTHLLNYTKNAKEHGIILHPTVTIGYDIPSEVVIKLLLEAAKNTKNLTRDFKPFVLQKSLNDFYVEYELNVYTKQPSKMLEFYSELNQSIQREFNNAGVEILSPYYHAYRDGNASTIPDENKAPKNPVEKVIDKVTGKT